MMSWLKEKRRKRKLRRGFEVWKHYFYYCKTCEGRGEVEMFIDLQYTVLGWRECHDCGGTGLKKNRYEIPDRYKELV